MAASLNTPETNTSPTPTAPPRPITPQRSTPAVSAPSDARSCRSRNRPDASRAGRAERLAYRLADEVVDYMKEQAQKKKPFFVCLWQYVVHWPIEAPDDLYKKYGADASQAKGRERYQAMVEATDIAIGKVLKGLEETGQAKNTLVVLTSDNGPLTGYTTVDPLKDMKGYLAEGGIRVPWMARWPERIKAGQVNDTPVITTDLLPTFLAAAGITYKASKYDGENILPVLQGQNELKRDALFWHYPHIIFTK